MSGCGTRGRSGRAAELLDASLEWPLVVVGSPPPHGNDLDLLVRPDRERAVDAILAGCGFACQVVEPFRGYPRGFRTWAAFRNCEADVVDAIPSDNFGLSPEEEERVEAEARPIPGYTRLLRPAPAHVLLLMAHNLLAPDDALSPLKPSRRARVRRALEEEPAAWERAAELAPAWGAVERLERLKTAFELGDAVDDAVLPGPRHASPVSAARAYRRAWRSGRLIAISGPDPGRLSTQAEGLRQALAALDIPARVVRPAIESEPAGVSPLALSAALRRAALPGLRAGEVVICHGYVLDALVSVRSGRARALLRFLAPPARRAYLIDSGGPEADRFRAEARALGVRRLDGDRPPEDLCAEIALEVWQAVR